MKERRAIPTPLTEPGMASAEHGVVILDGPDGMATTWTAKAAAVTGQRLIDAAVEAERQPRVEKIEES